MDRGTNIGILVTLLSVLALVAIACKGSPGPEGPPGVPGVSGATIKVECPDPNKSTDTVTRTSNKIEFVVLHDGKIEIRVPTPQECGGKELTAVVSGIAVTRK